MVSKKYGLLFLVLRVLNADETLIIIPQSDLDMIISKNISESKNKLIELHTKYDLKKIINLSKLQPTYKSISSEAKIAQFKAVTNNPTNLTNQQIVDLIDKAIQKIADKTADMDSNNWDTIDIAALRVIFSDGRFINENVTTQQQPTTTAKNTR